MKSLVEVEIFGQTFTVNSEEQAQYVKELADYVDQRMRQIAGSTKTVVPLRVAIMAALSIADEWYKANQENKRFKKKQNVFLRFCLNGSSRVKRTKT